MNIKKIVILVVFVCFSHVAQASFLRHVFKQADNLFNNSPKSYTVFSGISLIRKNFENLPSNSIVSHDDIVSLATYDGISSGVMRKPSYSQALTDALWYFELEDIPKDRALVIINNFKSKLFKRFFSSTFGKAGDEYVEELNSSAVEMRKISRVRLKQIMEAADPKSIEALCRKNTVRQSIKHELKTFSSMIKNDINIIRNGYLLMTVEMIKRELDDSIKKISNSLARKLPDNIGLLSKYVINNIQIEDDKVIVDLASACGSHLTAEINLKEPGIKAVVNKEGIGPLTPLLNKLLTR